MIQITEISQKKHKKLKKIPPESKKSDLFHF
jgi:hypothetical protein